MCQTTLLVVQLLLFEDKILDDDALYSEGVLISGHLNNQVKNLREGFDDRDIYQGEQGFCFG